MREVTHVVYMYAHEHAHEHAHAHALIARSNDAKIVLSRDA